MEFNEKLQKLRTGENLTQEELAEDLYAGVLQKISKEHGREHDT